MLKGEAICKSYFDRSAGKNVTILDKCNITVESGEIVGLMGKSGCGKSTLARILLRLIPCDSGKIYFEGQDITYAKGKNLTSFRQSVQFISQRPESFFDPMMTLGKSLREPLKIFNKAIEADKIKELLEIVKLNESVLNRYPHQVSGGEIQRLSIARALLLEPKILILDEPTSMLDISVQAQILHLLKNIQEERGLAYLLITHDSNIANWMCDRVVTL